jgi:hypothetical protein
MKEMEGRVRGNEGAKEWDPFCDCLALSFEKEQSQFSVGTGNQGKKGRNQLKVCRLRRR